MVDAATVLLARPGGVRERLLEALTQSGLDVVLLADPLEASVEQVTSCGARNLVIAVEPEVEDALERFDALLGDDRYRILFEEATLVEERGGWDVARWSRHLGAKLLGHGDVLPSGHEPDDVEAAPDRALTRVGAAEVATPVDTPRADDFVAAIEDSPMTGIESDAMKHDSIEQDAASDHADDALQSTWLSSESKFRANEVTTPAVPSWNLTDEAANAGSLHEESSAIDIDIGSGIDTTSDALPFEKDALNLPMAGEAPLPIVPGIETAFSTGSSALADDSWTRFQDYDANDDLPADTAPKSVESDYRAALSPFETSALPHDDAYAQLQQDMQQFDRDAPADRWQDFERPSAEPPPIPEAPALAVEPPPLPEATREPTAPPVAPSQWSLTDEPLPTAASAAPQASHQLEALNARISGLSLEADDRDAEAAGDTTTASAPAAEAAVLILGGIGGPDPLRQILQQVGSIGVPILVQQWLDGGHYDRLTRQMDRASDLSVQLAEAGHALKAGTVYIVPTALGLARDDRGGLHFADVPARGFVDLLQSLPATSSGVVILSGTSEDFVEPVQRFLQAGGRVFAQTAEGCYDHAVAGLLIGRGAEAELPGALATKIAARWQPQVSHE